MRCDGQNLLDIVDGDRFVSGYDTPDIGRKANCDRENALGETAKLLMAELMRTSGLTIEDSSKLDRYDRPLVVLRLPDGRTIGSKMLAEGLAVHGRPGGDLDWCQ